MSKRMPNALPAHTCCRRNMLGSCAAGFLAALPGCVPQSAPQKLPDLIWGRRGFSDGRLIKPRAIVIAPNDLLYIVDMLGRIQCYDGAGDYQFGWVTPVIYQGKPTGLGWSNDGMLMVADTHYFRVLFYSPDGELDESRTIGGEHGDLAGQFHFVTDVAQNAAGHYFVGQYGQIDRIQEFSPDGEHLRMWGSQGSELNQFSRPQGLVFDSEGLLWVADACNHRFQIYDVTGAEPELVDHWGTFGAAAGQLKYPYGFAFDVDGSVLVAEYGNHRIQRFTRDGRHLEFWGGNGAGPAQFQSPWGLGIDSRRQLHVLDSMNHRVQRFALS